MMYQTRETCQKKIIYGEHREYWWVHEICLWRVDDKTEFR